MKMAQDKLPKVKWGDEDVDNSWQFPYLGSIFQADGDQMPDIRARCAMTNQEPARYDTSGQLNYHCI